MKSLPPLVEPGPALSPAQLERFSRHVALPGLGVTGQRRLSNARVLVLGAGGLGSPVLHYLTAAGVGTLGIVDDDTVDLSNLQRQVIHDTARVGMPKAESAAHTMRALNPDVTVEVHTVRLTPDNAFDLFTGYDVVVDGTDNFATRYLANDTAAVLGTPYVWGSVLRFDAQVGVFWQGAPDGRSLDYRDLVPVPPDDDEALSCSDAGVLGAACGIVGSSMAIETVKLLAGIGDVLLGRVQNLDALTGSWREIAVRRDPARPAPTRADWDAVWAGPGERHRPGSGGSRLVGNGNGNADGSNSVGVGDGSGSGSESDAGAVPTIEPRALADLLARDRPEDDERVAFVDVREPFELDIVRIDEFRQLDAADPAAGLRARGISTDSDVIVLCKSGVRSARAVRALRAEGFSARSVRGGILAWVDEIDPTLARY